MSVLRLKFMTQIACFATLFEEKGTFYKKRGPKGDPFGPKGPLRDPGPLCTFAFADLLALSGHPNVIQKFLRMLVVSLWDVKSVF